MLTPTPTPTVSLGNKRTREGTPSLETSKRRHDAAEDDTATSFGACGGGMFPPPLAEIDGRRGSGVGSATVASPARPREGPDARATRYFCGECLFPGRPSWRRKPREAAFHYSFRWPGCVQRRTQFTRGWNSNHDPCSWPKP